MPIRWTEGRIYKLVLQYIKHECLWKCDDREEYNNAGIVYNAYLSIKRDMNLKNLTVNDIREKIEEIQYIYHIERAKLASAKLKGYSYKPRVFWFDTVHEFLNFHTSEDEESQDLPQNVERINSEPEEYISYTRPSRNAQSNSVLRNRSPSVQYLPNPSNLDTRPTKLVNDTLARDVELHSEVQSIPTPYPTEQNERISINSTQQSINPPSNSEDRSSVRNSRVKTLQTSPETILTPKKHKYRKRDEDEFDAFVKRRIGLCNGPRSKGHLCKSVACQLRQLRLAQALRIQTKIQSLLVEERLKLDSERTSNTDYSEKKNRPRQKHHRGVRASRSSRSSRSSCHCSSNFHYHSASELHEPRQTSSDQRNIDRQKQKACVLNDSACASCGKCKKL